MQMALDVLMVVGFILTLIVLAIFGFLAGIVIGGIVGVIAVPAYGYRIIKTYSGAEAEGEEIV